MWLGTKRAQLERSCMRNSRLRKCFRARRLNILWIASAVLLTLMTLPFWQVSAQEPRDKANEAVSTHRIHKHKISGRHDDWPWPLSSVPRRWTAVSGNPPRKTFGTTPLTRAEFNGRQFRYPKPIPPAGRWHFTIWPLYFGMTTHSGWHFRLGVRYDDIDGYYSWPSVTLKRYKAPSP